MFINLGEKHMKLHVSLDVKDINQSLNFYRTLFAVEPTKVKPGYAKFDLASPPVVLTLNEAQGCCDRVCGLNHMGVRVESLAAIQEAKQRLEAAGYKTLDEMNTTCCYAEQDKIWAQDPNGYRWEVYVFKGDADVMACAPGDCASGAVKAEDQVACCAK
jgi:catechol 2,3-dioxygenase-like lactoylglutathione lyase family enzyme